MIDNILSVFLVLLTIDVSLMFLFTQCFLGMEYVSTAAPFGLTYGPFLFWIYRIMEGKTLQRKILILHFLPFLLGVIAYFCYLSVPEFRDNYTEVYYKTLYGSMCISWSLYPMFVLIIKRHSAKLELGILKYTMIILLILTSFMLPLIFSSSQKSVKEEALLTGIIVISAMLAGACLCYWYMLGRFRAISEVSPGLRTINEVEEMDVVVENPKLDVKPIKDIFAVHREKIEAYLLLKRYYDSNFKLEQMAHDIGVPKAVISQYFVQEYAGGFVKTINAWRIEKACAILESEEFNISMEELAFSCGFNSRASFYRNFNLEKGCSPSVYREQVFNA